MNRTNICKNIVQSIKDYITDQVKLEPHRMEKHFVRRRKLSLLQVIIYLFFSSKASMFQNLSQIREELARVLFRMFQNRHFPKPDSSLILHCSRNFIIFLLICFTARSLQESCGRVIIFLQQMVPESNFLIQNRLLISLAKCPAILLQTGIMPWHWLP